MGLSGSDEQDEMKGEASRQGSRNRRRTKRRRTTIAEKGHICPEALDGKVRPALPISAHLPSESLPIVSGAWVGIDCDFYGAKKARTVEELVEKGMRVVAYKKGSVDVRLHLACPNPPL